MKRFIRQTTAMFLCLFLAAANLIIAHGADTSNMISKVSVSVSYSIEEGESGTVTVTGGTSRYVVDSWDFTNGKDKWDAGDIPRVKIILEAQDEYYFSKSINGSKVSVSGGGSYYSAKPTNDNKTLELTIKLKPVKGTLGDVEDAYWESGNLGRAKWEKVENANAYEVKLYRGTTMVHRIEKITTSSCNLYSYMTKQGVYYFKVRAIPRNTDESDYITSGQWCDSTEQEITSKEAAQASTSPKPEYRDDPAGGPPAEQFGWIKDVNGWWYKNDNRSYTSNGWQSIDGKWYLFDMAGYMKTGWQNHEGKDYHLTINGDMTTGWFQDDRKWYYLKPSGEAANGWQQVDGRWFYFGPSNVMHTGWLKWKDQWYYMNQDNGVMMTNTTVNQYYLNGDGVWVQ